MATLTEAIAHHKQHDHQAAQAAYGTLLQAEPNNTEILHLLAISHGQIGDTDNAERYIRQAIELDPKSAELCTSYANICKYQQRKDDALAWYNRALTLAPKHAVAHYNIALLHMHTNTDTAISHLQSALTVQPHYLEAYHVLLQIYLSTQKLDTATKLVEQAQTVTNNHPSLLKYEAQILQQQNNPSKAIQLFLRYLEIVPDDFKAHHHLAAAYLQHDDVEQATHHNLEALSHNPNHVESHHNVAVIYLTQNKLDLALKHWLRALSIETHIDYLYNIGVVYNYMGHYGDALSYFEKALQYEPDHYNSLVNLATVYLKKNMPTEAKFYFNKALSLKPDDVQSRYMLAALNETADSFDHAPHEYISALFDQYANTFDQHLTKVLQYSAPEQIANLLRKHTQIENSKHLEVCDIGCGTGLMAEQIHSYCSRLIGVDLSDNMLTVAQSKNHYTQLVHADITSYLSEHATTFTLITAADVLPYIGDLNRLFTECHNALETDGYFVFSCELNEQQTNFQLTRNGRFSHSENYIRTLLSSSTGWRIIECLHSSTRKEAKHSIPCLMVLAQKLA